MYNPFWLLTKEIYFKKNRESFHQGAETKLFVSAIIRGHECTVAKRYDVTAIMLRYILALSQKDLVLRSKVVASKSYGIALGIKEPLLLLVIIALVTFVSLSLPKVIAQTAKQKR
jgi:hypothetical protein